MKAKSLKLRILITLHTLFKYSDKDHHVNSTMLNEYLKPYNLDCTTSKAFTDTLKAMREYGIDVKQQGTLNQQGVWIEDRPFSNDALEHLLCAVTTNPYISKTEAEKILSELVPIVTVYQEPLLKSFVQKEDDCGITSKYLRSEMDIYKIYRVICEAIASKKRVRYQIHYMKYDKNMESLVKCKEFPTRFTPKCVYQESGRLYMVGYNNTDKRINAVDLADITYITTTWVYKSTDLKETEKILGEIDPKEIVEKKKSKLIYSGKAVFRCRGQYAETLYRWFGPASDPIKKDSRGLCIYTVENAKIDSNTLTVLADIPDHGIHIIGPESLTTTVREYYQAALDDLLNPYIPYHRD